MKLDWRPEWELRKGEILDERAARARLEYCLQGSLSFRTRWRKYVWTPPSKELLYPITRFAGKQVLEIGMGKGRMSCLFAAVGARVSGVELESCGDALDEARRWGVEDRVFFDTTHGDYDRIPNGPFDVVFTKSVLGFSDKSRYDELLFCIRDRLTPGGTALFLENHSDPVLYWFRRHVTYRKSRWDVHDFGLTRKLVARIGGVFDDVVVRRHSRLVWTIRAGKDRNKS